MSANYAYLDTTINDLVINGVDASGKNLRQAPENSLNIDADYEIPLNNNYGSLNINVHFSHVDEQRMDYLNDATIINEINLLDARIGWTSEDETYEVAIWGKNLMDKGYVAHSYVIGPGVAGVWGDPITFGVTGTFTF